MKAIRALTISGMLITLFVFSPVFAQWEYGGIEIAPNSWPTWDFNVSEDINGGILIAWEDNRVINNPDVYVQKVDTAGIILWQQYGVNGALSDVGQYLPFVASDGQGGAYIAWSDIGRNGGNYDIYAQHFDSLGQRTWDDEGLNIVFRGGHQILDHMISDGQGGALLCWSDEYWAYTDTVPVVVQRIDSSGNLLFGTDGIRMTTLQEGWQMFPQLIMTSDSAFVVIWRDSRLFGQGPGLYAQKFDPEGNILWDSVGVAVAVETVVTDYGNFKISAAPCGGFYTIWRNYSGPQPGIFMQWNDSLGRPDWGSGGMLVSPTTHGSAAYPKISTKPTGEAIICWVKSYPSYRGFLNIIDTTGTFYWQDHFLIGLNIHSIYGIAQSIPGEFEIGLERTDLDCARRILKFDMDGNYIWGDTGVCLTCSGCPSIKQQITSDGVGGAYLSWKRSDGMGVRLNRVYPDGWVAPDTTVGINKDINIPDHFSITAYPNPFNARTRINLQLSSLEPVEIGMYDLLGRKIQSVFEDVPRDYHLEFDIDLSFGEYSSGIYFMVAEQGSERRVVKSTLLK